MKESVSFDLVNSGVVKLVYLETKTLFSHIEGIIHSLAFDVYQIGLYLFPLSMLVLKFVPLEFCHKVNLLYYRCRF